jgi:hypothetical protein
VVAGLWFMQVIVNEQGLLARGRTMSKYPKIGSISPIFNQKSAAATKPPKAIAPPANKIPPPTLKGPKMGSRFMAPPSHTMPPPNTMTPYVSPKASMAKAAVAEQKAKNARAGITAPFNKVAQKNAATFNKAARKSV